LPSWKPKIYLVSLRKPRRVRVRIYLTCLIAFFLLVDAFISPAYAQSVETSPLPTCSPQACEVEPTAMLGEGVDENTGPKWWVDVSYLLWWLQEGRMPPVLTTGPLNKGGLLGSPDTVVLYGDDRLQTRHDDRFNGLRFDLGFWLNDDRTVGIEADAFFLERDSTHFKAVSDGTTLLARPYFLPDGTPESKIIAGPTAGGTLSGGFVGYSRIEFFGEQLNLIAVLCSGDFFRIQAFGGARFLQLRDRADLTSASQLDQTTLIGLEDHYRAHNAYYGGQVGLEGSLFHGRWSLKLKGAIGLGGNDEQVRTWGDFLFQTPTERIVTQTGLTVQAGNTGTFNRTALNMVSEAGLQIGYDVTRWMQVIGGYTFLLWDGPIRAGDQIDLTVNPNATAGSIRPSFKEDLFWAQGLNLGLRFSW
jgi:Putative beta barrel porin-7 (BBP7)